MAYTALKLPGSKPKTCVVGRDVSASPDGCQTGYMVELFVGFPEKDRTMQVT